MFCNLAVVNRRLQNIKILIIFVSFNNLLNLKLQL